MKNLKDEKRIDNIDNRKLFVFCLRLDRMYNNPLPDLETNLFVGEYFNYPMKGEKMNHDIIRSIVNL